MTDINKKQDIEIATMKEKISTNKDDILDIKKELKDIVLKVSNHIPHQINDLEKKLLEAMLKQKSWIIGIMVSILMLLLAIALQSLG